MADSAGSFGAHEHRVGRRDSLLDPRSSWFSEWSKLALSETSLLLEKPAHLRKRNPTHIQTHTRGKPCGASPSSLVVISNLCFLLGACIVLSSLLCSYWIWPETFDVSLVFVTAPLMLGRNSRSHHPPTSTTPRVLATQMCMCTYTQRWRDR